MTISDQRSLFSIPDEVGYFNCANMAPLLNSVSRAGMKAIRRTGQPWSLSSDDWFHPAEELRTLFARIISAEKGNIALIPSASYGIAIASRNLPVKNGEKIIVLDQQYPSNVYAWQELAREKGAEVVTVRKETGKTWTEALAAQIDETVAIVAIPNCHWTDGSLIEVELIAEKVRGVAAGLVIDASQSLGALPLDVTRIKPDFLISVGYKWLFGPYHLAYLYADKRYCDTGQPIEYSWLSRFGSEDFTNLVNYTDRYRSGARRFDGGEFPGFIQIPMAISALTRILDWGVENIHETLSGVTQTIAMEGKAKGYGVEINERRAGHMLGLGIPKGESAALSKKLRSRNVFVSFRGDKIRISPHLYNGGNDIRRLIDCL